MNKVSILKTQDFRLPSHLEMAAPSLTSKNAVQYVRALMSIARKALHLLKTVMKTAVERKKLLLIEEFLKLQNEDIINKIESILKAERLKVLEAELKSPFTEKEFNEMIDQAEKDASEGKVLSTKDLNKKVQSWK